MWKLPEEDDGKKRKRLPFQASGNRRPAQYSGHCSGKCADESACRRNLFEWCINQKVCCRSKKGEEGGEQVGVDRQQNSADTSQQDATTAGQSYSHPLRRQGTILGA